MSSNPRRAELKAMSEGLADLKAMEAINTINEGLLKLYAQKGYYDIRSLRKWNEEGRYVRKGEKALLLWGKPQPRKKDAQPGQPHQPSPGEEEQEDTFFPVAYAFDITQTVAR